MRLWPKQFFSAYFFIFGYVINKTEHVGKALVKNTQEAGHGKRLMNHFVQYYQSHISNIVSNLSLFPRALKVMKLPCK